MRGREGNYELYVSLSGHKSSIKYNNHCLYIRLINVNRITVIILFAEYFHHTVAFISPQYTLSKNLV